MLPDRFMSKVAIDAETGCWNWLGAKDRYGYGMYHHDGKKRRVYRVSWEDGNGPVPAGLVLDHFACDNRACANPAHVTPVTALQNVMRGVGQGALNARKVTCVRGHDLTDPTVVRIGDGTRVCRPCDAARHRKAKTRRSES
jgi:hypothetical protein